VRVVLDANILVRANPRVSPQGLARDLLLTVATGPHALILSSAILVEVQRVLTYPRVQARWTLAREAIEQYLVYLEAVGVLVEIPELSQAVVTDPDDDPILQTPLWAVPMFSARAIQRFGTQLWSGSAPRTASECSTTLHCCRSFGGLICCGDRQVCPIGRVADTVEDLPLAARPSRNAG
jgi:predicted nucleic acid-binding protein